MSVWLLVLALASFAPGCIESQRAQAPARDTGVSDDGGADTVTMDTLVAADDTLAQDTTRPDAALDVTDTSARECNGNPDCVGVDVGPCEVAQCKDHLCVAVAAREGLPCDDGDACTKDAVCDGGFCKDGTPVTCDAPTEPCREAICVSSSGCMMVKAAESTPCENGAGPELGACTAQGWAESDACDASGECVDRYRPTASGSGSAQGSWYFVASTAGPVTTVETARGWMDLGPGGDVSFSDVTTSIDLASNPSVSSPWSATTAGAPAGGFACGTSGGRVDLVLADGAPFRGQHTPNSRALAALEPDARRLLVAVRPTGEVAQVHGSYRFVSTSIDSGGGARTWFGEVAFEEGCVADAGGVFLTSGGGAVPAVWWIRGDSGCLELDDEGYAPHQLHLEIAPAGTPDGWQSIRWAGAIAPGGEVLVMTRDDDEEQPHYGTLALIRESPVASTTAIGPAAFMTFFHGAHSNAGQPTAELAGFLVSAQGVASGWLHAPAPAGLQPLIDPEVRRTLRGRYSHDLRTSSQLRDQSGWITAANDFGFFFTAASATSGFDLLESNVPTAPSLGFAVRALGQVAPTP